MGNEQSSPNSRRRAQNKLSKPRTNTTRNLLNSKGPEPSSYQNVQSKSTSATNLRYTSVLEAAAGEAGDAAKDGARGKRMSLFRSKSSQEQGRKLEAADIIDVKTAGQGPAESLIRRHTSANPITLHSVDDLHQTSSNARISIQHIPHSQHYPRLSLVPEAQSTSPEETEFLRRDSIHNHEDPSQHSNLPLPRTTSDTTLYAPIRRRSLLQPGVARRTSYIEDDPSQSLPSQLGNTWNDSRQSLPSQLKDIDQLQDYYYHPTDPIPSPISSQDAPAPQLPFSTPGQRVHTPNHLDYAHIGTHKLGSLRITNGAASPDLSDGGLSTGAEDGYLAMGKLRRPRLHSEVTQAANLLSPADIAKPWAVQAQSPLRQSHESERTPLTIETQLPALDPSLGIFDFKSKYHQGVPLDVSRDYAPELTLSPFSFVASPIASPELQATSKHMAVEDELFEPEPTSPVVDTPRITPRSFDWEYGSVDEARNGNDLLIGATKPLSKADSGYSSNVSERSFKKDTAPPPPAKDAPQGLSKAPISRVAASMYSTTLNSDVTLPTDRLLTTLRPHSTTPSESLKNSPPALSKQHIHEVKIGSPTSPPVKSEGRTHIAMLAKYTRRQSLPTSPAASDELPQYNDNLTISKFSTGSRRGNKIQKPRPQSMVTRPGVPVFTVQATDPNSGKFSVPPVSERVEQMLVDRVDGFPVTNFRNTISNTIDLRRTPSKETLGTIFSVGSAEVRDEISVARQQGKLPPVQGSIPEHATTIHESNATLNEWPQYQNPSGDPATHRKPTDGKRQLSWTKLKDLGHTTRNIEEGQSNFEAHVTSIQSVTSSLGRSPYDITVGVITAPKSLTANARARSMTSLLEADAAARFQRARYSSQEPQDFDIQAGLPFDLAPVDNTQSETSNATFNNPSYGYSPQAHTSNSGWKPSPAAVSNNLIAKSPPKQDMQKADVAGVSIISHQSRQNSPPPVSMQTQGQMDHILSNSHATAPPSRSPPIAPAPDREPPSVPINSSLGHKQGPDPWAKYKNFWAERRKSAEVLQKRKSMENVQAGSVCTSFDSDNESRLSDGQYIRRSESARPTSEIDPYYGGHTRADQGHHPRAWVGHSTGHHRRRWQDEQLSETYHHTYGSSYLPAQDYHQPDPEDDYFPPHDQYYDPQLPQDIHARHISTDEMLSLDPYPNGLGYNYQPGYGLVGNAGTRSVGNLVNGYGADFGHARNSLPRVRVAS